MKCIIPFLFFLAYSINSVSQDLYFPPVSDSEWKTIEPDSLNWCEDKIDNLYTYLDNNNSKAFILLKDGKIVLEQYFNGHKRDKNWYWASAGKSLTAFLVGIAQDEGFLSIDDMTSEYLGEKWTSCTVPMESKITIRNQLTMTTGLDDGVLNQNCTDPACLRCIAGAGNRWAYHNGPYTLLKDVIENASGISMNAFIRQKVKNSIGMNGAFYKVGYSNIYFSNARSMARFGLLMLNKGNWNGNQILGDTAYFNQIVNSSQSLNKSYGYLWWLNGKSSYRLPLSRREFSGPLFPTAPDDMISALGANGQFINVVPSENLVFIRMGKAPDSTIIPFKLNGEIWEYINEFYCASTNDESADIHSSVVKLFPNPVEHTLRLSTDKQITDFTIINLSGKSVRSSTEYKNNNIDISHLASGMYFIKLRFKDGSSITEKFIKIK